MKKKEETLEESKIRVSQSLVNNIYNSHLKEFVILHALKLLDPQLKKLDDLLDVGILKIPDDIKVKKTKISKQKKSYVKTKK